MIAIGRFLSTLVYSDRVVGLSESSFLLCILFICFYACFMHTFFLIFRDCLVALLVIHSCSVIMLFPHQL